LGSVPQLLKLDMRPYESVSAADCFKNVKPLDIIPISARYVSMHSITITLHYT